MQSTVTGSKEAFRKIAMHGFTVAGEFYPVIFNQTFIGSYPEIAQCVLCTTFNNIAGKSFFNTILLDVILLSPRSKVLDQQQNCNQSDHDEKTK